MADDRRGDGGAVGGCLFRRGAAHQTRQEAAVETITGARRIDEPGGGNGRNEGRCAAEAERRPVFAVFHEVALDAEAVVAGVSEENTSELQSSMRKSYAVFCLKKNKQKQQ